MEIVPAKEFNDANSTALSQQMPRLRYECAHAKEQENIDVHELPALEPVGSELEAPMEAKMLLFAMSEMRDKRARSGLPSHDTFNHP